MTENGVKIRWIGQSGYVIRDEHTTIYIDPYISDCVNRIAGRARLADPPDLTEKADIIICTHNHLDHLDIDYITDMDKRGTMFYAPSDCEETLKSLGVTEYVGFDCGAMAQVGNFEIEAVYAKHTVPAIGVVITHGKCRLYFTGDTVYDERLEKTYCDILFVCINGKLGNMNVDEAVKLTNAINPKIGIPNHYGMFASNTENPEIYTANINNGFIMEYDKEYDLEEFI